MQDTTNTKTLNKKKGPKALKTRSFCYLKLCFFIYKHTISIFFSFRSRSTFFNVLPSKIKITKIEEWSLENFICYLLFIKLPIYLFIITSIRHLFSFLFINCFICFLSILFWVFFFFSFFFSIPKYNVFLVIENPKKTTALFKLATSFGFYSSLVP